MLELYIYDIDRSIYIKSFQLITGMELSSSAMDSNDWEQLKCFKNFLSSFESATKALS